VEENLRGKKDLKEGGRTEEGEEEEEVEEEEEAEMWEAVRQKCSFEYMVANRQMFEPRSVTWRDPAFRFIRKGEVGDHRLHFTQGQLRTFAGGVRGGREGGGVPGYVRRMLVGGEGSLEV